MEGKEIATPIIMDLAIILHVTAQARKTVHKKITYLKNSALGN